MYKKVKACRTCGNLQLKEVYDLGVQPLANDFCRPDQESAGHAPLKVMFCEECTNSQLSVVVDPNIIYSNYPYVTSKSDTMKSHFRNLWNEITKEAKPKSLIEIGSNDGLFLDFCHNEGVENVLGVDPAANLQHKDSICSLFDEQVAREIVDRGFRPDVIVARHVFCHIDDWRGFMQNIEAISNPETLVVIEVPYVMDMLHGLEFDTIYHEHLDYLSIKAVEYLLRDFMFHIHRIVRFEIHGGAIVLMLRRDDCDTEVDPSVNIF